MTGSHTERILRDAPLVEVGVRGPRGDTGFLVRAPANETLVWDLQNEIASARLYWRPQDAAWWIAMGYFDTALDIILRTFPAVRVLYGDRSEEHVLFAVESDQIGGLRPKTA